jgi:tetratricopeptide (TPR) repeat protein
MDHLAANYILQGRHAEGLKLLEEVLALRRAKLGPDHPKTLESMINLAVSYKRLGRHAEALKLSEEVLARSKATLGPDHPETLASMYSLADLYVALGRHAEALKLYEELMERRKAKSGPDHLGTLQLQMSVAGSLLNLGRSAEAAELARQASERAEKLCRNTTHPSSFINAAYGRGLTALAIRAADKSSQGALRADAEADRAMAWLKQAVAAGWNNVASLETEHGFDDLRGRDDFKALMAELKARTAKRQ